MKLNKKKFRNNVLKPIAKGLIVIGVLGMFYIGLIGASLHYENYFLEREKNLKEWRDGN